MKNQAPKTNAEYTAKYAKKRNVKKINIDIYLNNDFEKAIYEKIKSEPKGNVKKLFLKLFETHYGMQ